MTREELIRELIGVIWSNPTHIDKTINVNAIADYILSRERLLLEKIRKELRKPHVGFQKYEPDSTQRTKEPDIRVRKALAIIEKEKV